jgi:hypothetical protein
MIGESIADSIDVGCRRGWFSVPFGPHPGHIYHASIPMTYLSREIIGTPLWCPDMTNKKHSIE